jgi:tRNA pseudouridine32 synthase/23S rRNA pseudouridine746 synthase
MGWPILGDAIYGNAPRSGEPPLHLHAREVIVPLYKNRAPVAVTAPVPPHMYGRLRQCGWRGEEVPPSVPSPLGASDQRRSEFSSQ